MSEGIAKVDADKLCELAHAGQLPAILQTLHLDKDLAYKRDKSGRTASHHAAAGGHEDIVQALITDIGIDPDIRDEANWTSLMIASSAGRADVVGCLLRSGAQVNSVNSTGQCSLHYAASRDRREIAEMLLGKGANPNIVDQSGSTPLHRAASKGHAAITKLLLSYSADATLHDAHGDTPLHMACEEERDEVVRLLITSGADSSLLNKDEKTAVDVAGPNIRKLLQNILRQPDQPMAVS